MECIYCQKKFEDCGLGMHRCPSCHEVYNPWLFTRLRVFRTYGWTTIECSTLGMLFATWPYIKKGSQLYEARIGVAFNRDDITYQSPFDCEYKGSYAMGRGTTPWAATYSMMQDLDRFARIAQERF